MKFNKNDLCIKMTLKLFNNTLYEDQARELDTEEEEEVIKFYNKYVSNANPSLNELMGLYLFMKF